MEVKKTGQSLSTRLHFCNTRDLTFYNDVHIKGDACPPLGIRPFKFLSFCCAKSKFSQVLQYVSSSNVDCFIVSGIAVFI